MATKTAEVTSAQPVLVKPGQWYAITGWGAASINPGVTLDDTVYWYNLGTDGTLAELPAASTNVFSGTLPLYNPASDPAIYTYRKLIKAPAGVRYMRRRPQIAAADTSNAVAYLGVFDVMEAPDAYSMGPQTDVLQPFVFKDDLGADAGGLYWSAGAKVFVWTMMAASSYTHKGWWLRDEDGASITIQNGVVTIVGTIVASGVVMASIVDVKGDLIVGTAADTVGRLGSGPDGTSLHAKSADANGLLWLADGIAWLTNKSGGSVGLGDVVILDTANTSSFKTTTSAGQTGDIVGVVQETIANNAAGAVLLNGYTSQVNLNYTGARGDYITTSTTVKQAAKAASWTGAIGIFAEVYGTGTTPPAFVWGTPSHPPTTHGGSHLQGGSDEIQDLQSGTSFPGSPATNRRFFRTDLGVWCYYDGTRWLGVAETYIDFSNYLGTNDYSGTTEALVGAADAGAAIYVTRYDVAWHVFTTNGVSNYYDLVLRRLVSGVSYSDMATLSTSGGTNDTWTHGTTTSFSNNPTATNDYYMQINVVKNGSPGNMRLAGVRVRGHLVYT